MAEQHATAYDSKIEGNVIFTRLDAAFNWVRKNSLWPMPMGLACCAIELMATAASRDRKSTRLNSSHLGISYAVFCLKKKKQKKTVAIEDARGPDFIRLIQYSMLSRARKP